MTVHRNKLSYLFLALIIIAFSFLVYWNFIGFRGYADDAMSIRGALLWIENFPYLGTTHWELRHPYVLMMSASVLLNGLSELSVIGPSYVGTVFSIIFTWLIFRPALGHFGALVPVAMVAITPIFTYSASTLVPGSVELALVLGSMYFFLKTTQITTKEKKSKKLLLIAGFLMGLAFVNRETAFVLVAMYFVLFIIAYRLSRRAYLILFLASAIPVSADMLYIYSQTGDLFYKAKIDIQQKHPWKEIQDIDYLKPSPSSSDPFEHTPPARQSNKSGKPKETIGPVNFGKTINSIVGFWVNHEYGIAFYMPFILVGLIFIKKKAPPILNSTVVPFLLLGLLWFLFQTYVLGARPHPRYFQPVVYAIVVLNAFLIVELFRLGLRVFAIVCFLGIGVSNLLFLDLQSDRLEYERIVGEYSSKGVGDIYLPNANAVSRSRFFVQTMGVPDRVKTGCPPSGALYITSNSVTEAREENSTTPCTGEAALKLVTRIEPKPRAIGLLLEALSILDKLPSNIADRLYKPGDAINVYQAM